MARFDVAISLVLLAFGLGTCARASPPVDDDARPGAIPSGPPAPTSSVVSSAPAVTSYDEGPLSSTAGEPVFASPSVAPPGAVPPGEGGACPSDMVLVEGAFCPNVQQDCAEWLEDPAKFSYARCARFREPSTCSSAERVAMRFCIDRDEYAPQPDELPVGDISWTEAKGTCERAGKRLCAEREWVFACEGEAMRPYPYGFERDSSLCNFDNTELITPDGKLRDHRAPSSSKPACLSPFGVRNMVGNVDEWVVLDKPHISVKNGGRRMMSGLKGGWWGPLRNRCRPVTVDHDEHFHELQTGFRCCAEASGAAEAGGAARAH